MIITSFVIKTKNKRLWVSFQKCHTR